MTTFKKARYVRNSAITGGGNPARQLAKLHPDEELYIDVISGTIAFKDRPQGKLLIEAIENGQVNLLSVASIDRLGRTCFETQSTLNWLNEKGVTVRVENLGNLESLIDGKPNPIFKMICDVLANVASIELEGIRERQTQGLAIYKAQNALLRAQGITRKRNKPKVSDEDVLKKYASVAKELKSGKVSLRKIAILGGTSLATVQKCKSIMIRNKMIEA
ncbi:MAG: recombinase family protein [Flavobacterium sp.]|jgi:DNA invertase Pin-like site-specific DNA recombinase|uniref:recombinase family protein n=1 Tax=Flavobacterium sp. TaxID=239 RepID=UPI0022C05DD1|nr:recombinase family protein [Flavobacterium sp.]MCZ8167695.1 recombinase family protein [Flavobacterium sp.]